MFATLLETVATIIILVLIILLLTHALSGTAGDWVNSKFHIASAT